MIEAPDKETFDKLLSWLDPDPNKAGEKYRRIQIRLIKIFGAKGCWVAEDLADQTINVVASKVDWLLENFNGDPALYFYGVGKNIHHEWLKRNTPPKIPISPPDSSEIEQLCGCLEECLRELPADDHRLVLQYHEGEKQERIRNRKQMALNLGISQNALRIKVCHIHARLRQLMDKRLDQLPDR